MSLSVKIMLLVLVPFSLLLAVNTLFIRQSTLVHDQALEERADLQALAIQHAVTGLIQEADFSATVLASSADVAHAVENADNHMLFQWSNQLRGRGDMVVVTDLAGTVLARAPDEFRFGDDLHALKAVQQTLQDGEFRDIDMIDGVPSWVSARRIHKYDDMPLGVVLVVIHITPELLGSLTDHPGITLEFREGGQHVASAARPPDIRHQRYIQQDHGGDPRSPSRMTMFLGADAADQSLSRLEWQMLAGPLLTGVILLLGLLFFLRRYMRPYSQVVDVMLGHALSPDDSGAFRHNLRALGQDARHGASQIARALLRLLDQIDAANAENEQAKRDLTATLESLRESERKYRFLIKNSQDIIYTLGPDGKFTFLSPSLVQVLGYEPDMLVGVDIEQIIHPDDLAECRTFLTELTTSGVNRNFIEYRVRHADGSWKIHRSNAVLLRDGAGNILGVQGNATDMTAIRQAESELRESNIQLEQAMTRANDLARQAEAASQAKSDFLANMSHEIRTPMNAVIGMAHLALRTELTPRQKDYMTKISFAARSLLGIINDILDFSKIEAGRITLEHVPFRLRDVVDNMVSMVGLSAREKSIFLDISIDPATPDYFFGDPLRLGQVLINLAGNAVKFTQQGEVRVHVREIHEDAEHGVPFVDKPGMVCLLFSIQDTGIGMEPEKLSGLFQPFWQADTSTTRRFGGTGLGLPISKQFVEMMGGTIWARSEPGQGSTFSFTVCLELADEAAVALKASLLFDRSSADGENDAARLSGRRVLLVEDNALNRSLMVELLADLGITVEIAVNGREGLHRAISEHFDLILMDIQMPEMDGYEATRRIRAASDRAAPNALYSDGATDPAVNREPGTVNHDRRTPIIAMTAHAMVDDRQKSLDAGMDDHLTKPVDPELLKKALLQWMPEGSGQGAESRDQGSAVSGQGAVGKGQGTDGREPEIEGERQTTEGTGQSVEIDQGTEAGSPGARQVKGPHSSDPHSQSGALLPGLPSVLPPFDIPKALARCNNKSGLLRKLLLAFGEEYAGAMARLRGLIAEANLDDARILSHSIKGVAATLEARALSEAAKAVEMALREERIDGLEDLLRPMEIELDIALAAVQSLARSSGDPAPEPASSDPDTPLP